MAHPLYEYAYICTEDVEEKIPTEKIESFLAKQEYINTNGRGHFYSENGFLSLQIMNVKSISSWSSMDYDPELANYIAITLDKNDVNMQLLDVLTRLSLELGLDIQLEEPPSNEENEEEHSHG